MMIQRLLFVLLTLSLIACGKSSPTPSTALPTVTPQNSSSLCGTVEMHGNDFVNAKKARDAETCFWQAYQQCLVGKMLDVNRMTGVNTSVGSELTLQSVSGQCSIHVSSGAVIVLSTVASGVPGASGGASLLSTNCTQLMLDEMHSVLHLSGCQGKPASVDIPYPG